jgi:SAM-dependent methyltransferase
MFRRGAECGNWQKYNSPNPLQQFLIGRFLRTVGSLVEQSGALVLADIGCAEGFVTRYVWSLRPEIRCVGIDIDVGALERGKLISPNRRAQQASIYNIPYRSEAFELVLCLEVLEHLDRPERALAELMRTTRRYCLVGVPHEPFFRIANFLRGKNLARLGNDIEHVNHWGKASFARFLQDSGLIVRRLKPSFPWLVALAERSGKT